ncbi:MAG: zinc ribbon domain-containing protein [Gammaproteobacteria bacterium]|nr:zinc ribbon domain-containing protein [Gammaproteobacteria bacterium]MBU1655129.1 zinc ribbon domain-containing protein [Gammaproteobacteria bacterium]MBU1961601.1 zinc ribbon domain-containing protein [Gammaproteobacteria bacterium]
MPTYDYRCEANGRVLEVNHRMSEEVRTWGELCEMAGVAPGDTPTDAPVTRMATGGNLITGSSKGVIPSMPPCAGGGCSGGMCGMG